MSKTKSHARALALAMALSAGASVASAQETAPTAQQPAAEGAAPAADNQLPQVDVIQKKTPQPVEQAQPKPKPKTQPVQEAAPQPKVKPKPVAKAKPQPAPEPEVAPEPVEATLAAEPAQTTISPSTVRMSPLAGSEMERAKVPSGVSSVTSGDIERDGTVIPQDTLNSRVPGVIIDDLQGNAFQTGVQYRGFEASPVNGLPQGLAVYQNGVRINEAFGDTVNWDFIPTNAIEGLTVISGNPIYGLNAIGGAMSIAMKDGFNYHGAEIDTRFGSFGRKQVAIDAGMQSGGVALYGAFEGINDEGFRDFSDAEVRRGYADLGFKGDKAELHFNATLANNYVGVTAAVPPELLAYGRERTFTSPQTTYNDMLMLSANGSLKATDTLTLAAVTYFRHFTQKHDDGNIAEFGACDGAPGLCDEDGNELFAADAPTEHIDVDAFEALGPLGSIDRTSQDAKSWGIALQAAEKARLFGLGNQLVVGTSYDHGKVGYTASSSLGTFLPRFVVAPTGPLLTGPTTITPRSLDTFNDYYGVYALDTLDLTDALSVTVGGRYNYARVEIDNTGDPALDKLNGVNTFERFNPSAGATYKLGLGVSAYGGYSEANRAPTASEIACSDPENPCIIESALASDPPLEQVVSKTWEVGLRGDHTFSGGADRFEWSVGYFKTNNFDDILQIADSQQGRGYFTNFGETQRQGVEASIAYRNQRFFAYANYAFIDATFETAGILPSENNPAAEDCPTTVPLDPGADAPTCVFVTPGDRLPGVPRHRLKLGADFKVTPQWTIGADLIAASNQIFYGDEGNDNTPLAGYTKVNLHTSYNITDNVQVYGLIENLFDEEYGIYGTYINVEAANGAAEADPSLNGDETFAEGNAKTITPAIPFAAYAGIKAKF